MTDRRVTARRAVGFLLPFAISGLLLVLLARSLAGQADALFGALAAADWRLVVPAIGLYFVGTCLRSLRWARLLPAHVVSTSTLFRALVVGLTVNNLLPLRMGEVARAYLLARWRGIPFGATIASLVVERVLDGLSLAILLLLALLFVPAPGYLLVAGSLAASGFVAGALLLALAAWRPAAITAAAAVFARVLPPRLGARLARVAEAFAGALSLVRGGRRLAVLLGLSLLAWCAELGVFYVLLLGFPMPVRPSYPLALLIGSAANFATLVPSSPGYVGTFDGVLVKVLSDTAGLLSGQAAAYALVVHATLFLPVVLVGTLVLWRAQITFGQITHAPQRPAATSTGSSDWPAAA